MTGPTHHLEGAAPSGYTVFAADRLIGRGDLARVARAAHAHSEGSLLVFDDATGRVVDLDLRGSADDAAARVSVPADPPKPIRGRPKLGVTAREITLLPRHWEWLATQPGGASAALRRLVDQARRDSGAADAARRAKEVAYRVMTALAGDRTGYEEATRALFAGDRAPFTDLTAAWPNDIASYVSDLAAEAFSPGARAERP